MKLRILLINPWVYDFAAVNLWSRPLGLLKVAESLGRYDVELKFIDCMDVYTPGRYGTGKYPKEVVAKPECLRPVPRRFGRYGMRLDDFQSAVARSLPFDIVLVSSVMSYWYPGVQQAIEIVRSAARDVPVILGGVYATLWSEHASRYSGADCIYKGPVSGDFQFVLSTFGFRLREKRELTPWYRLGLCQDRHFAPVMTSAGCPFSCSYCGASLLSAGFSQRDPQEVAAEIIGRFHAGVTDFAFYDDALLVNADAHLKPILRAVIQHGCAIRFHCPNGLHARFIDEELARLMKKAGFTTFRLGLETSDRERQRMTGDKVTWEDFMRAVGLLKENGFSGKAIGAYLMYGLPGQDLSEVRQGVEYLKGLDVTIHLTEFSPVPGTRCWTDLLERNVITSEIDPLLTNNTVFSSLFCGYDGNELERLRQEVKACNSACGQRRD